LWGQLILAAEGSQKCHRRAIVGSDGNKGGKEIALGGGAPIALLELPLQKSKERGEGGGQTLAESQRGDKEILLEERGNHRGDSRMKRHRKEAKRK